MRKKLTISLVISLIVFVISISALGILFAIRNNTKHTLTVGCQVGGYVELKIEKDKVKVDENTSEDYTAKRSDEVVLTAKNLEHFTFDSWFKDGKLFSSDCEIEVKVEEDVHYIATFDEITYELSVSNGTDEPVTFVYGSSTNLLQALKNEYATENGYQYKFFIGENEITYETEIEEGVSVRIEKSLIEYTIEFKHNNEVVETKTYTVENLTEVQEYYPTLPTATQGYTIAWKEYTLTTENLTDLVVNTVETPITYTAIFVYNGENLGTDTFSVEDQILTYPGIPEELLENGYECNWTEFVFNYEDVTIELVKSVIDYTISFKHNGELVEEKTYTVENLTEVQEYYPTLPTATQGYTIAWETYTLSVENLADVVVNTVETAIEYTVTFVHKGETLGTDTFTVVDKTLNCPEIIEEVETGYEYTWEDLDSKFNFEDVTLNSVYSLIEYTITVKFNDGINSDETSNYTVEDLDIRIENPTREGYKFIGWSGTDLTELTLDLIIPTGSIGNREYTANWELIAAKVALGSLTNVAKVYYGTDAENITTELTTDGFIANAETNYYFIAVLDEATGYNVVTFVGWTGAFVSTSLTTDAQTFKPETEDQVFTINAEARIDTATRYSISYDIEFKDDNPFPYNALYFVNNELYTYKNNKLNYIMSVEEYANAYYEVVATNDGVYHVYSVNGETVSSAVDFATKLKTIMNGTTVSIEIIYD